MANLNGKTALVTGGSRGIGRATATALAAAGARVLVHYGKSAAEAEAAVDQIRAAGGKADVVGADLAAAQGPIELACQVREIVGTRLDILVANAAIFTGGSLEETTIAEFDALFAVNVRAPFFLIQHLLPILPEGASIILTSSLVAHATSGLMPAYSATKGAIDTLTRHMAQILGPRGIRVNAVAPGIVQTAMSSFVETAEGREIAFGLQALKRVAQPDDIADAITFLASDAARWITGDILHVDGGSRL